MTAAALVLAAGSGERLGRSVPKAFATLGGVPLVVRALEALDAVAELDPLLPVVAEEELERFAALPLGHLHRVAAPVAGGAERQDSVRAGLAALGPEIEWVAVHDSARCLVRPSDVRRVLSAAAETGAAILGTPATDTIKRVQRGRIVETPARSECWIAQTPQVFRTKLLREAHAVAEAEGFVGTDDAELVERLGVDVMMVEGDSRNLKITLPEDLARAETWLAQSERGGESA